MSTSINCQCQQVLFQAETDQRWTLTLSSGLGTKMGARACQGMGACTQHTVSQLANPCEGSHGAHHQPLVLTCLRSSPLSATTVDVTPCTETIDMHCYCYPLPAARLLT